MSSWNVSEWFSIFASVALKSTVVLGAAWLAAWALRGRSAALRHLVWTAAAAAVLALPFLSAGLPALRVPASGALLPFDPAVVFQVATSAAVEPPSSSSLPPATARRGFDQQRKDTITRNDRHAGRDGSGLSAGPAGGRGGGGQGPQGPQN